MVRTIKRANADDRWKVVSPRGPFSAADLELGETSIPLHSDWRALPPDPNRGPVPRRLYIKWSDFMAHLTSDRCLGCRALVCGGRAQGHTEDCRIRVEGELRKTEEGKAPLRVKRVRFSADRVENDAETPEAT